MSLRVEDRRRVQPGECDLEGILAFEAAALRMKEMAEEEIERSALTARRDRELAGRLAADKGVNR